jgi:hypothetical protein
VVEDVMVKGPNVELAAVSLGKSLRFNVTTVFPA